jgi:hypothetical protein
MHVENRRPMWLPSNGSSLLFEKNKANLIRRFKLRISAERLLAERQGLAYNCERAAENLSDFSPPGER